MRANNDSQVDFWEWANVLWGCTPLFTDPAKDPIPAPLGGGVVIVDMPPVTPRTEEPRNPHLGHNGDFDPDQTQRIIIAWEGFSDENKQ